MEVGDPNKVWEIKALKRKPDQEEAKKMLDRIAKQVQPIMRKHKWRVKLLSEFCPTNPRLLGLNVGSGVHVKLRLRRPNRDSDFYPYDEVLDTMLHELCHNAHGPHNASFYKLWDELRKECEQLMENGISGSGQGFDLPGKRLGGFSQQPPLSSLRQASLSAAQKRQRTASLLPTGPNRLGGDKSIMSALSPTQAAAMAAERRLHDEIWCASASGHPVEEEDCSEFQGTNPNTEHYAAASSSTSKSTTGSRSSTTMTLKRKVGNTSADASSGSHCTNFVDLTTMPGKRPCQSVPSAQETPQLNVVDQNINAHKDEQSVFREWECQACTLLNPPLAPLCRVCGTRKPVFASAKYKSWFCKFCTLENGIELDKCLVCGHWQHSHGAPVSARPPNLGT